ncbi:MAG TPA: nucleotide exchange factor GrpE [Verrucomicrobiae bacterium]|nr:nucleotide exchange factor GrpE [Verrucomicrobiae bacterium]
MTAASAPKISKWPFFLGDAILFVLAWYIHYESRTPTGAVEILAYLVCFSVGAWLSVIPFLRQYEADLKFAEADNLVSATAQIQNIDQLAAQIGYATSQWQIIRDSADKTATTAKSIAEGMAAEVKAFNEFIQKTNEGEKATLRLEVDKLRRTEIEWLQVIVRILDHVFALHHAALQSRQPGVAEQISKFQAACVDVARRMGLVPFIAATEEPFDAQRHKLLDGEESKAEGKPIVEETLAPGFTFQGKLVRPALVRLRAEPEPTPEMPTETVAETPTEISEPAATAPESSPAESAPRSEPPAAPPGNVSQQNELL